MNNKRDLSTHGVIALVRNQAGRFLLLEDSRELMRGYWAPPHGRCEAEDESEAAGVVRETKEETGLDVRPIRVVDTLPADTKVRTVSFWIVELIDEQAQVLLDAAESSRYGWFSVDEALNLTLYPGTKTFFEKVKARELSLP